MVSNSDEDEERNVTNLVSKMVRNLLDPPSDAITTVEGLPGRRPQCTVAVVEGLCSFLAPSPRRLRSSASRLLLVDFNRTISPTVVSTRQQHHSRILSSSSWHPSRSFPRDKAQKAWTKYSFKHHHQAPTDINSPSVLGAVLTFTREWNCYNSNRVMTWIK